MGTSLLNLNQFTKGGAVSLLKSYNEDMSKIDAGISADRIRLSAAEQAIADLPTGGYAADKILPLGADCSATKQNTLSRGCRIASGTKLIKLIGIVKPYSSITSAISNCRFAVYDWNDNLLAATEYFPVPTSGWEVGTAHEYNVDYTFSSMVSAYGCFRTDGTGSYNYLYMDIIGIIE